MTRSEKTNADITALLKARHTLLWIVTREEVRVERAIIEAAGKAPYDVRFWDCVTGITKGDGGATDPDMSNVLDPMVALGKLRDSKDRAAWVFRDLHKWMDAITLRCLRTLARSLQAVPREEARSIIILTPVAEVPIELAGHATVIDYPIPERAEIARILETVVASLPPEMSQTVARNGKREQCIDAAVGLSAEEAANCYAKSLVTCRDIDPAAVSAEKRRVIARERVLTWHDPDPRGLDAIGGLEVLKDWLRNRKAALSQRARAFGLPAPKGILLVGPPGTGKSLTAKAVSAAWGIPLLRLDMGALKSKYVGESEGNIRKALAVAETVAPAVIWIDEIEKALAGSTGPQGDGGVSADALGTILSWMQERAGAVFVVATANDVSGLPPELLRKGRFDELFFIDLPNQTERAAVLRSALQQHNRTDDGIDLVAVARQTQGFTGAELAALVPDALFAAFNDGERAITTSDMLRAAESVTPLSRTAGEKIAALRSWAKGRTRPASATEASAATESHRALDL